MKEYRLDLRPSTDLTALGLVKHELQRTKDRIKTHKDILQHFETGVLKDKDDFTKAKYKNELSNLRNTEGLLEHILHKMLNESGGLY